MSECDRSLRGRKKYQWVNRSIRGRKKFQRATEVSEGDRSIRGLQYNKYQRAEVSEGEVSEGDS